MKKSGKKAQQIVLLRESDMIGTGNERHCYIHPENNDLCIKINKNKYIHRNQNKLEQYYFKQLIKRKAPFDHIAGYYGTVNTNKGEGLVFEYIKNEDGSPCNSIVDEVFANRITKEKLYNLLDDLRNHYIEHWISIGDVNTDQIKVQFRKNNVRLVLVDGLGTRRAGLKLLMVAKIPFFARRKTGKNWKKLIKKIDNKINNRDIDGLNL